MPKKTKKSKSAPLPERTAKEEKLYQNLLRITQQFMQGKGFLPMSETELMERLQIPPQHIPIFQEVLTTLVHKGHVELTQNRYFWKDAKNDVFKGIVRMHPRGFGFVQLEDTSLYSEDIFIPKHFTQNAVDGDTVEVAINNEAISERGPEGRIVAILSRGRTHLAGIVTEATSWGEIVAYAPLLGTNQRIKVQPHEKIKLVEGDRIVMEIVDWGTKETETLCRVSHKIGHISDPQCDIAASIEEYEIRSDFPRKVVNEAKSFGTRVSPAEIKIRKDLRGMTCFTIDPDTAKDFDDAISLTKNSRGEFELGVHIADVSHYVKPGSALDVEALQRCNSTYFPGRCIPMLPSELSDNLCSLKANVNRLTVSIFMHFDKQGNLIEHHIARSVIKSAKRFSYKEAKQVLDGKKTSPHAASLKLMVDLCKLLKKKRYERGSIEFAIPELIILVDEQGVPQGTDYIEYDITHQLVEEFMLKANETVASHLDKIGKNLTYRVHEAPAAENLKDFASLAGAFGFSISDAASPSEIQKVFDEALNASYGQFLATCYIRKMRLAAYSADNIGHYGLALTHYCHFTSPIRRYIDLVVHRILLGESIDRDKLELVASECSEQERISAKAENSVMTLKKLRLLDSINQQKPQREYEAVVTRVKNFGIYFEILEFMLEGFLHVSELENDYYIYDEAKARLRGNYRGGTFACGDKISVLLKDINFVFLETKWHFVGGVGTRTKSPKEQNKRRQRKQSKAVEINHKKSAKKKARGSRKSKR